MDMRKVILYSVISMLSLLLIGCLESRPHMPAHTPEPFPELNGKAYAVLAPWKAHPDYGSYLVIYDLENLKVAKRIPLEGTKTFVHQCHYWGGKYYFRNFNINFSKSQLGKCSLGVVNSNDGSVKYIPLEWTGQTTGITQDGKMYILSNFYDREKGLPVTVLNAKTDEMKIMYSPPPFLQQE